MPRCVGARSRYAEQHQLCFSAAFVQRVYFSLENLHILGRKINQKIGGGAERVRHGVRIFSRVNKRGEKSSRGGSEDTSLIRRISLPLGKRGAGNWSAHHGGDDFPTERR